MQEENRNKFNYTYSAPTETERKEIEEIRSQYLPDAKNNEKLERLKSLDFFVRNTAKLVAFSFGVFGVLVFGLGLSMVLSWALIVWGSVVCALGACFAGAAYPLYRIIFQRNKKKYGPEILRLSRELLNERTDSKSSD
jgi:hypothetical protein